MYHRQLSLFNLEGNAIASASSLSIPPLIVEILGDRDCALSFSISGGKDSQAMLNYGVYLRSLLNLQCETYAIHADLGRIEWKQTPQFVKHLAQAADIPLVVVRREQGDMIDRWQQRRETLFQQGNTKPFWSSSTSRYCTKELKIQPIDKYLRRHKIVICAIGLRAEESQSRAKKLVLSLREDLCTNAIKGLSVEQAWSTWNAKGRPGRFALNWNAIHDWQLPQVWEWCGTSLSEWQQRRRLPDEQALDGWAAHPAYVLGRGNERLSCAVCVLGSQNDLTNAIPYNQETFNILLQMETDSGWSFQPHRSL